MALYIAPPGPYQGQYFDDNGAVLAGGKLYSYQAGTTTPLATYQDVDGNTAHANPIALDADGRPPAPVWLIADTRYKFILKTSVDVELDQWDNVFGIAESGATLSEWLSGATPTFVSATTFTQQGDTTTIMSEGRRLKLTDASTLYATISAASYAAGTNKTTITVVVDGGTSLTSSLSAIEYGLLNSVNPSVPDVAPSRSTRSYHQWSIESLSDAAASLLAWHDYTITPTATRVLTLPTTGVQAGDRVRVINLASAQKVTINASAGSTKASFQDGAMTLYANQATPTTPAHWDILEAVGGASPTFSVYLSANQSMNTTYQKVQWNTEEFDTNSDFDPTTNYRFTPNVPGKYVFAIHISVVDVTSEDVLHIGLYKNGSIFRERTVVHSSAGLANHFSMSVIVDANGTTDYFEVYSKSTTDANWNIDAALGTNISTIWTGSMIS